MPKIIATPEAYSLTPAEAGEYLAVYEAAVAAYERATTPQTRTASTVFAKDEALARVTRWTRRLVAQVQAAPATTDGQRFALGIRAPKRTRTRVGPPDAPPPRVRVTGVDGRRVKVLLNDAAAVGDKRPRRAAGAKSATVMRYVGDDPPELGGSGWELAQTTSGTRVEVVFPEGVEPGTRVWVTAFWLSPTSQPGPACPPVETRVNYEWMGKVGCGDVSRGQE